MVKVRSTAVLVGVLAVAVGLTSCKSSNGDSGSKGPIKSDAAIRLLVDAPIAGGPGTGGVGFPQPVYGAKAAANALNKKGGINGHKIVIDACDNKTDPGGGEKCALSAKQNGDLAVVGSFDVVGASKALPILEKAGIPWVGGVPASPQELSSPISFQFDGGIAVGGFGTVAQAKDQGCTSAVDFSPGGPSASLDPLLKQMYQKAGISLKIIVTPANLPDLTPLVSQALATKPECIVAEGTGQITAKIIGLLRKQGSKAKIFTAVGALVPQVLTAIGTLADGVYADNTTLLGTSDDPTVTQFRNDMIASMGAQAAAKSLDEFAQIGWSSVMLVKDALQNVKDISSTRLIAALNAMTDVTVGNVKDHLDFTKTRDSKLYPRLFNTYVRYFVVKNGRYTEADGQWHDASEYIP